MPPTQPFAHDWDRVAVLQSEQWNWLAVEIAEIQRCAAAGDQAHDRLALILLDHLAEVVMGREVNTRLALQVADSVVEEMREFRASGGELDGELSRRVDEHVGPDRRRKMDKHLHETTKYLVQVGYLSFQEREVLDRLHEYRNGAYHQDELEPDLIADLVLAYRFLANELLARHRPLAWAMRASGTATVVTPQQLVGRLVEGMDLDLKAMGRRFCDHATRRVQAISAAVSTAQGLLRGFEGAHVPVPDDAVGRLLSEISAASGICSPGHGRRRD